MGQQESFNKRAIEALQTKVDNLERVIERLNVFAVNASLNAGVSLNEYDVFNSDTLPTSPFVLSKR